MAIRWVVAGLLCLSSALAAAQGRIRAFETERIGNSVEIRVLGENLAEPKVGTREGGQIAAFDFHASMVGTGRLERLNHGDIAWTRIAWQNAKPPVIRVQVRFTGQMPKAEKITGGWVIRQGIVRNSRPVVTKPVPRKVVSDDDFPETVPPIEPAPRPTATPVELPREIQKEVQRPVARARIASTPPAIQGGDQKQAASVTENGRALPNQGLSNGGKSNRVVPSVRELAKGEPFPTTVPPLEPATSFRLNRPATSPLISLDFVNTDLVQVLKALAMQSGVNIVTSPDVKGTVTVSLRNVDVDAAMRLTTGLAGVDYALVDGTYIVAPNDKLGAIKRRASGEPDASPEPEVTETYLVRGGAAIDLVRSLGVKDGERLGRVGIVATPQTSQSRQAIVLRGPKSEVTDLMGTLQQMDFAEADKGVFVIYDVKHSEPRALREDLVANFSGLRVSLLPGSGVNPRLNIVSPDTRSPAQANADNSADRPQAQAQQREITVREDRRTEREEKGLTMPFRDFETVSYPMRLALRGTQAQIDEALSYLSKIDVAPKRIAIEMRVMELNREEALRVGLDWSLLRSGGTVRLFRLNQGLGDTTGTPGTFTGEFSGVTSVLGTLDQISNKRNLLARPNLMAIDGRETELFVGDVVRFIRTIQATQNGTTIEVGEERVGVRLALIARVGAGGNLMMDLRPIVSVLRGFTAVPGGGQLPQTSERIVQSTAIIRSGETIALGGLILDQDRNDVRGIPILKDLPLIGMLFRRTDRTNVRSEVVFFLTAKVIDDATESDANPTTLRPGNK